MDAARLGSIPLFEGLSKKEGEQVARLADEVTVGAGERLIEEGRIGWEFFVLESGGAEVSVGGEVVATLGAGDFFGEVALKDEQEQRRTATVTTTQPSTLIVMTAQAFRSVERSMPEVAERIQEAVAGYRR